jgi:four helix bundle protein
VGLQQSLRGTAGDAGEIELRSNRARAPARDRLFLEDENLFRPRKLDVYQEAIGFCGWVGDFLAAVSAKAAAKDQLDRASTSIPLNIAEGNSKFSVKDLARFLEMARGSALECGVCLDVLLVRKLTGEEEVIAAEEKLARIVRMLIGLLRKFSDRADVLREDEPEYSSERDYDHEHE